MAGAVRISVDPVLNAQARRVSTPDTSPEGKASFAPRGDFHQLRLRLYALLFASDALCLAVAFLFANQIRLGDMLASYGINTFAVLFPVYVAVGVNGGAWTIEALQNPRRSFANAVRAFCFAVAVASILFFSLKIGEDFSRLVFGIGSLLGLMLVGASRLFLGQRLGRRFDWTFQRRVLLLDGAAAVPIDNEIVIAADKEGLQPVTNDPRMLDRLSLLIDRCERLTLACPPERREAWVRMLAGANVDVEVLAPELDGLGALGLQRHGDAATLLVARGPLGPRDRFLKRLLDLLVAVFALLLLSPLFMLVALAIRAESPGPIFFRQPRIGRSNRMFEMLKFRSMRHDAADRGGHQSTSRRDERITRVGQFLRSTSLDELPQLINVIKGEMSIVGPRPHPIECKVADEYFWSIDNRYFDRHGIKPGLTGLAQVRGFRGATWERTDLTNRLKSDLEYVDGWHIGRDLWIMARTLGVMIHPNAF
jgi:exopolysaccharide biosynthesis polyprenyl glycosylphosphotransferase